jgi:hypothetical protein
LSFPLHEGRVAASTTQVPLFALFALKASFNWEATNSNNAKGGTILAEARQANETLIPHSRRRPGRNQHTTFGSVISASEKRMPSRPRPDFLTPPNGIESRR